MEESIIHFESMFFCYHIRNSVLLSFLPLVCSGTRWCLFVEQLLAGRDCHSDQESALALIFTDPHHHQSLPQLMATMSLCCLSPTSQSSPDLQHQPALEFTLFLSYSLSKSEKISKVYKKNKMLCHLHQFLSLVPQRILQEMPLLSICRDVFTSRSFAMSCKKECPHLCSSSFSRVQILRKSRFKIYQCFLI